MKLLHLVGMLAGTPALAVVASVTCKWNPVTTMDDGTPIPTGVTVSYNLYGSHAATGPWSLAANYTSLSAVRTGVQPGLACYRLTAVAKGIESFPTDAQCVTVAASTTPATPTGFTVTQP